MWSQIERDVGATWVARNECERFGPPTACSRRLRR